MSEENIEKQPFYIGLCMAGAVSAGAYTAGVMDFLLEALEEWEKRKTEPGVPNHQVQIPVMGGASAGGMTSILAATALNNKLIPVDKPAENILAEHPENKLYHSWVDLTDEDMLSRMLNPSDVKAEGVISALNSDFIDQIARKILAVNRNSPYWLPLPPYIKPGLKLFTTLTNLQGFDYSIDFGPGKLQTDKYHMSIHNDYACFELTENTIAGDNAGWIPLNLKDDINTAIARDAAMATGAFPVGLKSRFLNRDAAYVNANPWLNKYLADEPLEDGNYNTLNIDGGLINNEPFEKVRDILSELTDEGPKAYNDFNRFRSTVVMIEPFPTTKRKPIRKVRTLLNVMGLTLSSMISQMRSKPKNLSRALKETNAGQYLIAPARKMPKPDGTMEHIAGDLAIACGALNGFSGFINKEFRIHDYFLGRHNCKIFLRDYFTIPESALEENPIFKEGYRNADRERFKSKKNDSYQIIPIFKDTTDFSFPDIKFRSGMNWPVLKDEDIDRYRPAIKSRVQAILLNLTPLNPLNRFLIWLGAKVILNRVIAKGVIGKIKKELVLWKLLPDDGKRTR